MNGNTMADLRKEIASRLRETLHGREIDTLHGRTPELPEMIGVVSVGQSSTSADERGTILDSRHEFWQNYYKDINTRRQVTDEIQTAIHSLRDDGTFEMTEPYGEDAGILYTEVSAVGENSVSMSTECANCGGYISTTPTLEQKGGHYFHQYSLDCSECEFSRTLETRLNRV